MAINVIKLRADHEFVMIFNISIMHKVRDLVLIYIQKYTLVFYKYRATER
jgi:hypothetical protein